MNCQQVREDMQRHLDQDLTPEETAALYRHIAVCPGCAEEFQMLKLLSRELEDLPAVTPPFSLVDSILPQLDAIDQARDHRLAEAAGKPAEVLQPPRRAARSSWWSSMAGRTAVGAAAALLVLTASVLSYEPKQLSDADIPYASSVPEAVSESSGSMPAENQNSPEEGGTEAPAMEAEMFSQKLKSDEEPGESPAQEELPQQSEFQRAPQSQPPMDAEGTGSAGNGAGANSQPPAADSQASSPEGSGSSGSAESSPPSSPEEQDMPEDPALSQGLSDQSLSETAPPQEREMLGTMDEEPLPPVEEDMIAEEMVPPASPKYGISMMPVQWLSPDGRYRVLLEGDRLVIYSVPAAGAESAPVKVQELIVPGEWISGQWSEDGKSFVYYITAEGTEKKRVFSLDSLPAVKEPRPESETAPETKAPAEKPSQREGQRGTP
ncbi:zf-HC2 domain-containing protein [Paenibacillus sp. F411]|uniref:anti-sigma factor family protein n=1 Tax=Paenibacillus sp. F411 TaxID=2820239 RepID=UPI001AAEDC6A|nr:zf-HC2 domain-containing protein [Paenibacillus sp. F411]MBO2943293.1 zf-HC2 domain-containing protein [Paenibacillus sp. F411]